jgi:hypothetical protein
LINSLHQQREDFATQHLCKIDTVDQICKDSSRACGKVVRER